MTGEMWAPPGIEPSRTDPETRVRRFVQDSRGAHTHVAKQILFTNLLHDVFHVDIVDLLPGIEKKVGSRVLGVRGSIDQLFQAAVIEVKTRFDDELSDAQDELRKYLQALREDSPLQRFVGLVTDLETFQAFRPVVEAGVVSEVKPASRRIRIADVSPADFVLWLDSLLFSERGARPTAESLNQKFGPVSPAFQQALDTLNPLWVEAEKTAAGKLKMRLWARAMEIVYGEAPNPGAFVADTYLSILVRMLTYLRLEPSGAITESTAKHVLSGSYFVDRGISNLIEEDFFSWVLEDGASGPAVELAVHLGNALRCFDMTLADEDLFKEIYQEIVGIGKRHGTGEFYTPRWLCEFALGRILKLHPLDPTTLPRILDPACGSGGFLTVAIHEIAGCLKEKASAQEILDRVLTNVVGIDVNPIAVTICRANYVIALGDLLQAGSRITVPVFVADSIKQPALQSTVFGGLRAFNLDADGSALLLPESVVRDSHRRSLTFGVLRESIVHFQSGLSKSDTEAFLLRTLDEGFSEDEKNCLAQTLETLLTLVESGRNSIWAFMMNNFYGPSMFSEQGFDIVLGNPPWVVLHSVTNREYQGFLKHLVEEYRLLPASEIQLHAQIEMATIFFRRCADLYLREGGLLGFLMPISVTTAAKQHARFLTFESPKMALEELDDFKGVSPIFSLPPCLLIARKAVSSKFPIPSLEFRGSIAKLRRNAPLSEVGGMLKFRKGKYSPPVVPTGRSPYYELFKAGAAIYPRSLWFIEGVTEGRLGTSSASPLVRSSRDVDRVAKREWKGVSIEQRVDSEFVFSTFLGKDVLPFGTMPPRPLVLPLERQGTGWRFLQVSELRGRGYPLTASWLKQAQSLWERARTEKGAYNFPLATDAIDYFGLLTNQDPSKRFVVIYNARGADAVAAVLDRGNLQQVQLGSLLVKPKDFIAEKTTYLFGTNQEDEAHFVCAVLNSAAISRAVKPFQPRGAYGARDLGSRPFMLSIPQFDKSKPDHRRLVELSKAAHRLARSIKFEGPGFRSRRAESAEALKSILRDIDKIVTAGGMDQPAEATPRVEP